MRDPFLRICCGMILVLLVLIACRQGPTIVDAAAGREYRVVYYDYDQTGAKSREDLATKLQMMLNQQSKEGWELVLKDSYHNWVFRK